MRISDWSSDVCSSDLGFKDAKISVVVTTQNVDQLDDFKALADTYGATLRITRLRPSGRGADVWDDLHPTPVHQVQLYEWLRSEERRVGKSVSVRVDLGGRRIIKKKKIKKTTKK